MKNIVKIAVWTLTILLASLFITVGVASFLSSSMTDTLTRQGFPDWLRFAIGVTEICAALFLLVPRLSTYATGFLGLLVASFLFLYLWRGEAPRAVVPGLMLVLGLVALTGYLRRPRAFYMTRLRAAADQVAEREIAAGRQRLALRRLGLLNDSAILNP